MIDKLIFFNTEYSTLQQSIYCSELVRSINPNMALGECRLLLEHIIKTMIGAKGNLQSRIIELEESWDVPRDIIDHMHKVRLLGNSGVHDYNVFQKEAERSLEELFSILLWFASTDNRLVKKNVLLPEIMFCVSKCYADGIGTRIDDKKSIFWLKKAIDKGYFLAFRDMAEYYVYGEKIEKNYIKAIEYAEKAAKFGSADAMCFLGVLYLGGFQGIPQNDEKAYYYLFNSYQKGNLLAEYIFVDSFYPFRIEKIKNRKDNKSEFDYLEHIAKNGLKDGKYKKIMPKVLIRLGDYYFYDEKDSNNMKKSFDCYKLASESGEPVAFFKVGNAYEHGYGVEVDLIEAEKNYAIAASKGVIGAKEKEYKLHNLQNKNY